MEQPVPDDVEEEMVLAFAPLHKRAFGTAVGLVLGGCILVVTGVGIVRGDPPTILSQLRYYLPLFDLTWTGAVLGALSGFFAFFCAGWFLAFTRNFALAASIWVLRTRVELAQTRDFLDHI